MHQVGFHGLGAQITRRIMASGWPGLLCERLAAHLDSAAGLGTRPVPHRGAGLARLPDRLPRLAQSPSK